MSDTKRNELENYIGNFCYATFGFFEECLTNIIKKARGSTSSPKEVDLFFWNFYQQYQRFILLLDYFAGILKSTEENGFDKGIYLSCHPLICRINILFVHNKDKIVKSILENNDIHPKLKINKEDNIKDCQYIFDKYLETFKQKVTAEEFANE